MLLVRGFEDLVQSLFLRGEVYGTTHLYSGQEAVAVGFASVLQEGDRVACTYRGHGHLLAMGTDPEALLAELLGRATGVNGGRAGSMNVVDPEHGVMGCYGIVGGSMAAATGAALALRDSGAVAVAYFGDGATNQAYFFECLNFAKVLTLPVVFVCENNGYGEYTPMAAVTAGSILAAGRGARGARRPGRRHGRPRGPRARRGDGSARARRRWPRASSRRSHTASSATRGATRDLPPPGELDRWKERDPLLVASGRLRDELGATDQELDAAGRDVEARLEKIEEAALAAPFPEPVERSEFAPAR